MILVDSSVWIDYFNKSQSKSANELSWLLINAPNQIGLPDIVVTEVLQGIRDDNIYNKTKKTLLLFTVFRENKLDIYLKASEIFRKCKAKGLAIRSTIDVIIAAIALKNNLEIFTLDKDFINIAKIFPLKLHK